MRYDKYPESVFRLLGWATGIILLGGLVVIQVLPLMEIRRGLLNALIVVFGGFTLVLHRYILPRAWYRD